MFDSSFPFHNTSSSSAACLLSNVSRRKEGIYTLTNAVSSRFVKLFPAKHIARDVRAGRERLFSDTLQHRCGASEQSAQNRTETVTSLPARSLNHRQRASCLINVIVCKQRLLRVATISLSHIRYWLCILLKCNVRSTFPFSN